MPLFKNLRQCGISTFLNYHMFTCQGASSVWQLQSVQPCCATISCGHCLRIYHFKRVKVAWLIICSGWQALSTWHVFISFFDQSGYQSKESILDSSQRISELECKTFSTSQLLQRNTNARKAPTSSCVCPTTKCSWAVISKIWQVVR